MPYETLHMYLLHYFKDIVYLGNCFTIHFQRTAAGQRRLHAGGKIKQATSCNVHVLLREEHAVTWVLALE